MMRPFWLGRAVRNRHRHAIEQASRRWRGGRRGDSARTRRKTLISTQVADEDLDAACPDIDAPYEFSSTEMCAQVSTDDPEQPPDESDAATRAVLAAAAVVAALVF